MKLPVTRGDCKDGPRPCPFSCRYRLEGAESCALDVADRGEALPAEAVGALIGLTKSGVEAAEARAIRKMQDGFWLPSTPARERPVRIGPPVSREEASARRMAEVEAMCVRLLVSGPMTAQEIAAATGQSPRQARDWLKRMAAAGTLDTGTALRSGQVALTWSLPKAEAAE